METVVIATAIGILLAIAYGDLRTRRIPNVLTITIVLLGLVRMIFAANLTAAVHTLGASALVFAAAFLLFWRGVFGGGDAKLIAAMTLLVGADDLLDFLVIMGVCGGALGLAILAHDRSLLRYRHASQKIGGRSARNSEEADLLRAPTTVPYGVAIAAAGVVMLILRPA